MANRVCEKCIHYDVCLLHEDNFIDDVAKNGFCGKFKNKAEFGEVVRCKDCSYCQNASQGYLCLRILNITDGMHFVYNKPNDFCSYGERRDT